MLVPLERMSTNAYRTSGLSMLGDATCSYVVPTFNEARRLPDTIEQLVALSGPCSEVIFVDDGSDDATVTFLESATRGRDNVRVLRHARNRGKGAAIRDGVFAARGETVVFMDADLATDLGDIASLHRTLAFCDVVIGSRALANSVVEARDYRATMGRVFNGLAHGVARVPYRDTQCGFKAFHARATKLLFALGAMNGFAFDVEVLMFARELGLRVEEVPVHWKHVSGSHIRPLRDPARMTADVISARVGRRRNDPIAVISVDGAGDPEATLRAVRGFVRTNDLVVRDDDAVHLVLGHLCPVDVRHVIANRLTSALDRRAVPTRLTTSRLIDRVQRRPRLSIAPPVDAAWNAPAWKPTLAAAPALAGVGS